MVGWHKAPHRPWEPDERDTGLYTEPVLVPETFFDDYATRSASARRAAIRIAENLSSEDLKVDPPTGLSYEEMALWKH